MTSPPASTTPKRRLRWLNLATIVWLLLVGMTAIAGGAGLWRLTEQVQGSAREVRVAALEKRLIALEQHAEANRRQPRPIGQAELANVRQALEARLAPLEHAQQNTLHADALQALQTQLTAFETRLEQLAATAASSSRPVAATPPPAPPAPPFQVIGIESRGGERFLAILPAASNAPADLRLLRVGEREGGWLLQAIERQAAVFEAGGQTRRLALP